MEWYTMFLDWKNQHCENDSTTQSKLQIQCNPYQTTTGIFHKTRTKNFTICMETQKIPNSQSNLENKERSWMNQTPWLLTILQSDSNQDSLVLAQIQTQRSMKQNREPRYKPIHLWSITYDKGGKNIQWRKDSHMRQKNRDNTMWRCRQRLELRRTKLRNAKIASNPPEATKKCK